MINFLILSIFIKWVELKKKKNINWCLNGNCALPLKKLFANLLILGTF